MPTPRLIKENHLDPEFLRRLLTGGNSASFDAALTEYVKKTDKITKSQIHQDYLNEVNDAIAAVEAKLANYYSKLDPITREEIDSNFESDIAALEISVARLNQIADGLDETVADTVNSYLENSTVIPDITEEVRNNVQEVVNNMSQTVENHGGRISALEIKTETLESDLNVVQNDLNSTNQSVQTVQGNISTINNSIDSINTTLNRIQNIDAQLEEFRNTCAHTYRNLTDKIVEEDLDPVIVQTISDLQAAVETLQNIDFSPVVNVEGSAGQVATIDFQGSLIGADLVYFAYIYDSEHEIRDAQFNLFSPIIDVQNEKTLQISHDLWDVLARRNQLKESVPLDTDERVLIEDAETEEDANWPKDTNESDWQILTLTEDYLQLSDGLTLSIQNEEISVTNPSIDEYGSVSIGFYGKRFKLYGRIIQEEGFEAVFNVDERKKYDIAYSDEKAGADSVCVFCLEQLSEGPHRIKFKIEPESTLRISTKFKINLDHGALLYKEDIFPDHFWDETLYDGGDYFHDYTAAETDAEPIVISHTYPEDLKSERVVIPNPGWYEEDELDYSDIRYIGKFICNTETKDLYYCNGSAMLKIIDYPRGINLEQMEAIMDELLGDDDEDEDINNNPTDPVDPDTPVDPDAPTDPDDQSDPDNP